MISISKKRIIPIQLENLTELKLKQISDFINSMNEKYLKQEIALVFNSYRYQKIINTQYFNT